jgi:lipopolysaccharide transport system permease protein
VTTIVLTIVFSRVAHLPPPGAAPYALLVFAAMLPWQFFSTALAESSNSLIGNSNLISKVYFPRLIIPAGAVVTSFVDFAIMMCLMGAMMLWYGYLPDWRILTFPFFVLVAFATSLGGGLWLAALNVKYRDFRYVIPFILQFGVYVSPVGFSTNNIPSHWRLLYAVNPLVGIIDGARWSLLRGESPLWWPSLITSIVSTLLLCLVGIMYFRRTERLFADII